VKELRAELKALEKGDSVERWELAEKVFLAMLADKEVSDDERNDVLKSISDRFPGSKRAKWLTLMELERKGMHAAAFKAYLEMGDRLPFARKRIIALHIKVGSIEEAISALCDYLELFQADAGAWRELMELYATQKQFEKAIYCSEEVLLAYPKNAEVICRHAELLTLLPNVALARKYFCLAAELICENDERETNKAMFVRSLNGILESKADGKLADWTANELAKLKQE